MTLKSQVCTGGDSQCLHMTEYILRYRLSDNAMADSGGQDDLQNSVVTHALLKLLVGSVWCKQVSRVVMCAA